MIYRFSEESNQMAYLERIHVSFTVWCRFLDQPTIAKNAVIVLLLVHTGLLAYSGYVHSPTFNEPAHLVAGLSHWEHERFELYRVNPPLVRMVAALPVIMAGYKEDWTGFREAPGARPIFLMGEDFVAANGKRSFFLFMIARWACIPLSWIGGIACYLWARDLYGRLAGIMACTLWCFSPNILAHGSLITADVGGTALGIAACYSFWRWLQRPTWTQTALTGVVLGLAELAKTTLILFYPLWPLLWLAYRWQDRKRMNRKKWCREAAMLCLRMAIGLYVLNTGYGFEGTGKPLKDFHFVSHLFTGKADVAEVGPQGIQNTETLESSNRFADSWLGAVPVPFPENYLSGIDVQRRDFENYDRPFYLRGQWQDHGWWYYYLYACAIKVPMGTWLLAIAVLAFCLVGRQSSVRLRDQSILIFPSVLIFAVASANTGLNEHMRYVLPCFPFAFVWLSQIVNHVTDTTVKSEHTIGISHKTRSFAYIAGVLMIWSATSSLWIYPHSLSYFNETVGGPRNGSKHLLHSNIDWGQDLRYLDWRLSERSKANPVKPLYLSYFGFFQPVDVGFTNIQPWPEKWPPSQKPGASMGESERLATKVYAVSQTLLKGYPWMVFGSDKPSKAGYDSAIKDLNGMEDFEPVGYSIKIYRR